MHPVIAEHLPQIEELCQRYNVERLEVFGSVANGTFDPERSDVDLLVSFGSSEGIGAFRQYMQFLLDCEELLGRKVDLVEDTDFGNPYFRKTVNRSRRVIYARRGSEAAV